MTAPLVARATWNLLDLLRCPTCKSAVRQNATSAELTCVGCDAVFPVENGIPRFVQTLPDPLAKRTQASFGYEWTHFNDWSKSGDTNFQDYFHGIPLATLAEALVLDAGCGMGRHARQIARFARHVVAVDFSRAIDQAAHNTADQPNVNCIQADILALPLADGVFDFVYSLGVLHHLADTERALAGLVAKLRPGGRLRLYLYWKKHGWQGHLLRLASFSRRVTTRLPLPILRALCWLLSIGLYGLVVLPYRALSWLGFDRHRAWPLFVYSKYPFTVLYNDQFDRFSAPLEKRYDPHEIVELLRVAGLSQVQLYPQFGWIADGVKNS